MVALGALFCLFFLLLRGVPHAQMLWQFAQLPNIGIGRFISVVWEFAIASIVHESWMQQLLAIALPLLMAANIVFTWALWRKRNILLHARTLSTSLVGIFFAIFGAGCFACGTVLLVPLLSILGIGGIITLLPYGGIEIAMGGVVLLLLANGYLLYHMTQTSVCVPKK